MWTYLLCRLPVAQNHNFGHILTFGVLPYRSPFTDKGQIWCATTEPRSTVACRISSECVHCLGFWWPKTTIFNRCWHFGAPVPTPFYRWESNLVCYSKPAVYAYLLNFVSIGLFCRLLLAKNPNFYRFLDFGIQWCRQLAAVWKSWTRMHNYKPSPIQWYQNCAYSVLKHWHFLLKVGH